MALDLNLEIKMDLGGHQQLGRQSKPVWPGVDWTSDFHMQAQVFTEKVSCQGLFWEEKFVYCCIFGGLLSSSQSRQS